MEKPRNLDEYRKERAERLEALKQRILEVAQAHLDTRTDGAFVAIFKEVNYSELELCIVSDMVDAEFTSAPERVLNEVAIDVANELYQDDRFPYTVDIDSIKENLGYIRIVKM